MKLWRISDHHDLRGAGGLRANGRWHSRGLRIVYLSDSSPGTLLEVLVHLEIDVEDIPEGFSLLQVEASDEVAIAEIEPPSGKVWKQDVALTRRMGDAWLVEGKTALARVPSSIIGGSWNFLLNPVHADAKKIQIKQVIRERFDPRLFKVVR
jgi:RES domain-containing protein